MYCIAKGGKVKINSNACIPLGVQTLKMCLEIELFAVKCTQRLSLLLDPSAGNRKLHVNTFRQQKSTFFEN